MNTLITVTTNQTNTIQNTLDSIKVFGVFLNKSLSVLRMTHWFCDDYNTHNIIGDLYKDLNKSFDILMEEIIGTSKQQGILFPSLTLNSVNLDDIYSYSNETSIDTFNKTCQLILANLNSNEFKTYVDTSLSGINNTKEEIISSINKANYLLSMVKM
jgi:hypothetical protein